MQDIQTVFQSSDEKTRRRIIQDHGGRSLKEISKLFFCVMVDVSWRVRKKAVGLLPVAQAGKLLKQTLENETNDHVRMQLQSLLKGLA